MAAFMQESIVFCMCLYAVIVEKVHVRYLVSWWVSCNICESSKYYFVLALWIKTMHLHLQTSELNNPVFQFIKKLKYKGKEIF